MDDKTSGSIADEPSGPLPGLTPTRAFALAAGLFLLVTGYGVLNDGYHSDDWRHIAGVSPLWTAVEGRWLLEVIFRDLLGERFLLPIQLALAFPCLYWAAHILSRWAAAPTLRPAATLAVFAIGTNHLFMADVLSFASNVFAYPFALALSVVAFELVARAEGKARALQVAAVLAAGQLLAFSVAIYQTFAVAGLIVPVLALVRADRVSFATAVRLAVLGAIASVVAIGLYLLEWRLYAATMGIEIEARRFQAADAAGFRAKLGELPTLIRGLHTGTLMRLPFSLRAAMGLFSLVGLGLLGFAALSWRGGARARTLAAARMAIGAGLAFFVFPILFWLAYEGDSVPPRAFGYIGFWTAAVFVAGLTLAAHRLPRLRAALAAAGLGVLGFMAAIFALTASAFWSDSARIGERDRELARAIYARLATLPGYSGPPFRLVGSVKRSDLSWGTLAGWSSLHAGNPRLGIFREMFGLPDTIASLPVSPRRCHAFPAAGSAFIHEGMAYLCLEEFEPFTDALACAPLGGDMGQFCLGPRAFVHIGETCLKTGEGDPTLWVTFHRQARAYAPERSFGVASFPIPIGERCYTVALSPAVQDLDWLGLRLEAPDGSPLWQDRLEPSELIPYAVP